LDDGPVLDGDEQLVTLRQGVEHLAVIGLRKRALTTAAAMPSAASASAASSAGCTSHRRR